MEHTHRNAKQGIGHIAGIGALLLLFLVALPGCRITDHSENDTTLTPDAFNIPSSGFEQADPDRMPVIVFDSTDLHMGRIAEGQQVERQFNFVNRGKVDLVITDVRASCGCTVARDWPRMPVAPGAGGSIKVNFDSEGRPGMQHKTITVVANTTPPTTVLTLNGEVVAPAYD